MRIYFNKKEHEVLMTDGLTVKAYNGAPSGFYEGIDLWADDAAEKLKDYFANAELNDYDDIWCDSSSDYAGCEGIISESELVFDSGIKRIVYSVTDYNGEDGFSTAYFYSLEEAKAEVNRRFNELGYQEQAKKAKSNDYILISEELEDEDGEIIGDINSIEAFYWKDYVLEEKIKRNTEYVISDIAYLIRNGVSKKMMLILIREILIEDINYTEDVLLNIAELMRRGFNRKILQLLIREVLVMSRDMIEDINEIGDVLYEIASLIKRGADRNELDILINEVIWNEGRVFIENIDRIENVRIEIEALMRRGFNRKILQLLIREVLMMREEIEDIEKIGDVFYEIASLIKRGAAWNELNILINEVIRNEGRVFIENIDRIGNVRIEIEELMRDGADKYELLRSIQERIETV